MLLFWQLLPGLSVSPHFTELGRVNSSYYVNVAKGLRRKFFCPRERWGPTRIKAVSFWRHYAPLWILDGEKEGDDKTADEVREESRSSSLVDRPGKGREEGRREKGRLVISRNSAPSSHLTRSQPNRFSVHRIHHLRGCAVRFVKGARSVVPSLSVCLSVCRSPSPQVGFPKVP